MYMLEVWKYIKHQNKSPNIKWHSQMQKTNIFICVIATKQNVFYSEDERIQANDLEHFDT